MQASGVRNLYLSIQTDINNLSCVCLKMQKTFAGRIEALNTLMRRKVNYFVFNLINPDRLLFSF
jgi:hypothetical protein